MWREGYIHVNLYRALDPNLGVAVEARESYNHQMERTINEGERDIVFTVKRSRRRRSVALRVDPSGAVTVFAPPYVWGPFIDRFVRQQTAWILKKLAYFKERTDLRPLPPPVTEAMRAVYTDQTRDRLPPAIERISQHLDVKPRSVRVANQKSRWGSCSVRGDVRFSWRMALLPQAVFDYIVVHELAHLRAMNHSPNFWSIVATACPDYKIQRKWLRQNSWRTR